MARSRTSCSKKNGGIVKLKNVVEKVVQKSLSFGRRSAAPKDVKEGHFAVIAVDDDQLKRFIVPLSYLNHPAFLRLLEQAAEEFGFDHDGALAIPCRPTELERILADDASAKTMVQSW